MSTAPSIKDRLAKAVGYDSDGRDRDDDVPSISNADLFIEHEPTVGEFLAEMTPTVAGVVRYISRLFPFIHWIGKYNLTWFIGDLIAGVTVGAVVVPQGMAYAQLAQLPVQYGLYTSFMGVLVYWFFATSKDITIGPVAVMSQVTGDVVLKAKAQIPDVEGHVIASALAVITGAVILFLGLARLGWIVELIPLPAICAFMTGSAVNIISGQVSKLLGIRGVNTRDAPYLVIINTLKNLPSSKLDAALGLTALFMLYLIRGICSYMSKRQPQRAKTYFFISTLRTVFVILLYTAISAGVNVSHKNKPSFSLIKDVPGGFQHASVPQINKRIVSSFSGEIPSAIIVMLIEHISISKSFGRINNYVIDPSQELVAIGVTNLLAPFLGAYPATGSFSRTAIKSKAGVRTPFAGVITAAVVLLALYGLPAVFYYIPNAALAAVIIHAVGDVITPPKVVFQFWRVSPLEVPIFVVGVLVTVFSTIENGIYTTIGMSAAVLIWRLFLSRGRVLGVARIRTARANQTQGAKDAGDAVAQESDESLRTGFLPLDHEDGSNPRVVVQSPYPGVFVYRFAEGFNYPNAGLYMNHLTDMIFKETRRTDPHTVGRLGDRPWNDPTPRHQTAETDDRPTLKAIILDFSSVNNVDVTAAQALIDVRNQLDRYAAPNTVDWHFANIENRWTKRALAAAGFGYRSPKPSPGGGARHWRTIFSIADLGGSDSAAKAAEAAELGDKVDKSTKEIDVEIAGSDSSRFSDRDVPRNPGSARLVAVQGLNRPYFHFDLQEALEAAIANAERK